MFDVGFWELLLIGIVALVVIGPERLPEVARSVGVYVAKFRRFVAGVKSDINTELETGDLKKILGDQREQISELRSMVDSTRRDFEATTSDALTTAKSQLSDAEKSFKKIQDAAAASATPEAISAVSGTAEKSGPPAVESDKASSDGENSSSSSSTTSFGNTLGEDVTESGGLKDR